MLFRVLLYISLALPRRGQWRSHDEAAVGKRDCRSWAVGVEARLQVVGSWSGSATAGRGQLEWKRDF